MKPKEKLYQVIACVLIVGAIVMIFIKFSSEDESRLSHERAHDLQTSGQIVANRERISGRPVALQRATRQRLPTESSGLDFIRKWDALQNHAKGYELLSARSALIREAGENLTCVEFTKFVDEIIKSGEYDNYIMTIMGAAVMALKNRDKDDYVMVTNIVNQYTEIDAQKRFFEIMGGVLPKEYFQLIASTISDSASKQSFLTGYCGSMIQSGFGSPIEAFLLYQSELPSGGDYSGLVKVAAGLNSDFERVLEFIPDNGRSIAEDLRTAIIRRWSEIDHETAISYIMDNPERIDSRHLATAIKMWASTDRKSPTDWAKSLPSNQYKDVAINALVDIHLDSNPERAWQLVIDEISDSAKEESLKKVHAAWTRINHQAAEAAKTEYENAARAGAVSQ